MRRSWPGRLVSRFHCSARCDDGVHGVHTQGVNHVQRRADTNGFADAKANVEKDKKLLEAQCKDAATRADEAEVNALKGGRKAMIKMETRIRELESELDAETRRYGDVTKNLRKSERSIKELSFAADEDRKNHERMQALIDQLQGKVGFLLKTMYPSNPSKFR